MRHPNAQPRPGLIVALILAAALSAACGDDFGTQCTLPANDVVEQVCEGEQSVSMDGQDESSSASCVVENIIECDSRLCARYRGSTPFCTLQCSSDSDCPGSAFCTEFVIGTGKSYCVKGDLSGN
ncbi:MAG: hypothetical protein AAFX99_31835 [Myxococcota bacterium]